MVVGLREDANRMEQSLESLRYSHENADGRSRVLVVDDDEAVRNILYKVLEGGGYEVLSASNALDALAICRQSSHPIDLLVTDYNMPEMNGLELARQCSAVRSELIVLYISGTRPDRELCADLDRRNRGFLAKPFRSETLRRKVKELLLEPGRDWSAASSSSLNEISR